MRERLGKIPEKLSGSRVDLFREEAQVVAVREQPFEELARALRLAAARKALDEPERADEKRAFVTADAVHAVGHVAAHESVRGELLRDELGRGPHTRVVEVGKADDRDQEVRRVRSAVV